MYYRTENARFKRKRLQIIRQQKRHPHHPQPVRCSRFLPKSCDYWIQAHGIRFASQIHWARVGKVCYDRNRRMENKGIGMDSQNRTWGNFTVRRRVER